MSHDLSFPDLVRCSKAPLGDPLQHLPTLAVADFLNLQRVPGKGRGVFTSKDCQQGTWLLTERAFSLGPRGLGLCFATVAAVERCKTEDLAATRRYFASYGSGNEVKAADHLDWWLHGCSSEGPLGPATAIPKINRLNCMSMSSMSETEGSLGGDLSGMFPFTALLNHACVPTASIHYFGDAVIVHAARDLKEGEEITNAYITTYLSLEDRQSQLLEMYDFRCHCLRCRVESLVPKSIELPLLSTQESLKLGGRQILEIARATERAVFSTSSEDLLQEISSSGLRLRGCFMAPAFPALMERLAQLDWSKTEACLVAELLQEIASAALPCSPAHSYCCSLALAILGTVRPPPRQAAISVVAGRALSIHNSCYGGGALFWVYRLRGSPAANLASAHQPLEKQVPCLLRYLQEGDGSFLMQLSIPEAVAADSLEVQVSKNKLRVLGQSGQILSLKSCFNKRMTDPIVSFNTRCRCLSIVWP